MDTKNIPMCHRRAMVQLAETDNEIIYSCTFCTHQKIIPFTPQQKGGRAVAKKYGSAYMAKIGRKGFQRTTEKHFDGDSLAHKRWLTDYGKWVGDATYRKRGFGIFDWPGYHPGLKERPF